MRKTHICGLSAVLMLALASTHVAYAQDPGGDGGLKLEFQGRFDALTIAGVEALTLDGSERGITLPAVPFMTPGVRILGGDLFLGLGLGFGGVKAKTEAGGRDAERKRNAFMLVPTATYDFLGDDTVALYGLGMLKLGKVGGGEDDPGDDVDGAFWWGLNLGVGLRGAISQHVNVSTEFGWGFAQGTWEAPAGVDETRFGHGLFGVIGFAVDLDL